MSDYRLLSLAPRGEHALSLSLADGDGEAFELTVGESVWQALGAPTVGDVLDEGACHRLREAHEGRLAYQAAVRILEYSSLSRRGLYQKLVRKGFSRRSAELAVLRMSELGYIREDEQARALAASLVRRNLWGPRRVLTALCAKGYSREDAEGAIASACEAGEINFASSKCALLAREAKKGAPPEKLRATLYRYGYGSED